MLLFTYLFYRVLIQQNAGSTTSVYHNYNTYDGLCKGFIISGSK